ncbi:MAG: hypothetical protein LBR11_09165, partial [Deltaproteobacteria bacterium]|nr:hypothetical protein [Deltaproteobacteria bacterium]
MSRPSFITKLSSFLILSLYIIAIFLTFFLIVILSHGVGLAAEVTWDEPTALVTQKYLNDTKPAIYPEGSLTDNKVSVTVDVNAGIFGGYTYLKAPGDIAVSRNQVYISGVSQGLHLMGGYVQSFKINANAVTTDNFILIRDSHGQFALGARTDIYGDISKKETNYSYSLRNEIQIFNSTFDSEVVGGGAYLDNTYGNAEANHNKVYFDGGSAKAIYGGLAETHADFNGVAKASDNIVYLKDVSVNNNVYVGAIHVYDSGEAINNKLTLTGQISIGENLRGGYYSRKSPCEGVCDFFSGNVLSVVRPQKDGARVGANLGNFEEYNFLFSSLAPSGSVGLLVEGEISLNDGQGRGSRLASFNLANDGVPTEPELELVLMSSPNMAIDYEDFETPADSVESLGPLLAYDLKFDQQPNK